MLKGKAPERRHDTGRDQAKLLFQPARAGLDLGGPGIAIPRRPAPDDVADKDPVPVEPRLVEHLVEEFPRPADERNAEFVLPGSGGLAEEHHPRLWISGPGDDLDAGKREIAARAAHHGRMQGGE